MVSSKRSSGYIALVSRWQKDGPGARLTFPTAMRTSMLGQLLILRSLTQNSYWLRLKCAGTRAERPSKLGRSGVGQHPQVTPKTLALTSWSLLWIDHVL